MSLSADLGDSVERWFGGSKITTGAGKPKVVFHGTQSEFSLFDESKVVAGFHFGSEAQARMRAAGPRATIIPAVLHMVNPRRSKDTGGNWADKIRSAKSAGYDGIIYLNRYEGIARESFARAEDALSAKLGRKASHTDLDALTDSQFKKLIPEASDSVIAFWPRQIRRVDADMDLGSARKRAPRP